MQVHPISATLLLCSVLAAQSSKPTGWSETQQKGFAFLLGQQQKDGAFGAMGRADTGITAIGLAALQSKPKELRAAAEQKAIETGLEWLAKQQDDAGGFPGQTPNYNTCACIQAFVLSGDARYRDTIAKADRFVRGIQHVESRNIAASDPDYGSFSYGGRMEGRGDLSNLSFALEALRMSGASAQDEAVQKAVVFLQRTQNLRSVNPTKVEVKDEAGGGKQTVESGNDGGAVYYPGNSPMGYAELDDGTKVARSYGSMTYALLKAYLLAGLPADDNRVKAAVGWIEKNWTVKENPGADPKAPEQRRYDGLYYQYMLMAKALKLTGKDRLSVTRDGKAVAVDWREELRAQLESVQKADGSWVNEKSKRFWEDLPVLVTAFALDALQHTGVQGTSAARAASKKTGKLDLGEAQKELDHMFDRPANQLIGETEKAHLAEFLQRYEGQDLAHLSYAKALHEYFLAKYEAGAATLDEFFTRGLTIANREHSSMAGRVYLNALRMEGNKDAPDVEKLAHHAESMTRLYDDPVTIARIAKTMLGRAKDPAPIRVALAKGIFAAKLSATQKDAFLREVYSDAGAPAPSSRPGRTRNAEARGGEGKLVQVGQPVAPFVSELVVNGPERLDLASYRGKVVVLDFFATWCPPCRASVPGLVELQKEHASDVQVLGVTRLYGRGMDFSDPSAALPHGGKTLTDLDKEAEVAINATFVKTFGVNYPLVFTTDSVTRDQFGVSSIPSVFVIGRDGKLVGSVLGGGEQEHKRLLELVDRARQ